MTSGISNVSLRRGIRAACAAFLGWGSLSSGALAGPLAVIELYQSQGCSSCPPANANINALADRADILALSFGVTYWDDLGWKDTFATPANTKRQWDYARGNLRRDVVGTPQVVINGRQDLVGNDLKQLEQAITNASLPPNAPELILTADTLSIGAGKAPKSGADIWLIRYDPRTVQVSIRRGENGGRTLPHRNIVRQLVKLGAWSGAAQRIAVPEATDPKFRTAILLQGARGGPILAALKP